jgi:hypothetical protein
MSAELRFTTDTNVLIYGDVRDSSAKHRIASGLLTRAAGRECLLTLQALSEFYAVTTRKRLLPPGRARSLVEVWLAAGCSARTSRTAASSAASGSSILSPAGLCPRTWSGRWRCKVAQATCAALARSRRRVTGTGLVMMSSTGQWASTAALSRARSASLAGLSRTTVASMAP